MDMSPSRGQGSVADMERPYGGQAKLQRGIREQWKTLSKYAYSVEGSVRPGFAAGATKLNTARQATPGPGDFPGAQRHLTMGADDRPFQHHAKIKGFGTAPRKCMVRQQTPGSCSTGPGSYAVKDSVIMGCKAPTFDAMCNQRAVPPEVAQGIMVLRNLRWRVARIKEVTNVNTRPPGDRKRVLRTEGKHALASLEARVKDLSRAMRRLRPAETPERVYNDSSDVARDCDRRIAPSRSRVPAVITPGPCHYRTEVASRVRSAAFSKLPRDTDPNQPVQKSLCTLRITDDRVYFGSYITPGPGDYSPSIMVGSRAAQL